MSFRHDEMRRFFRGLSGWVWNRQGQAFDYGLSLQEETLTEMLLLQIAKRGAKHGLKVKMFSRAEESVNGADWEWFFKDRLCSIGFRVQAKRLYRSDASAGRYDGLDKKSSQTDNLIKQAGANNPIYVFYNHNWVQDAGRHFWGNDHEFRGSSMWGCAIAKASFIKSVADNKVSSLRQGMRPWHQLLDPAKVCPVQAAINKMPGEMEFRLAEGEPEWLGRLYEPEGPEAYLEENNLKGVAFFDASYFGSIDAPDEEYYRG